MKPRRGRTDASDHSAVCPLVTAQLDGDPRISDCLVDLGAYESLGVPLAAVTSAVSIKGCELDLLSGLRSEPRQPGITEILLSFDLPLITGDHAVSAGGPGGTGVTLEEASCSAPTYIPYQGDLDGASASAGENFLYILLPTELTNARTYRFNFGTDITCLPNQSLEVRGLIGDITGDGWVNATDRSIVVAAWTSPEHFSCETDLNNDGATNATDRSIVVAAWTGQGTNCAPTPGLGEGGESMGASGGDSAMGGAESSGALSDESAWTPGMVAVVGVEVRALGGSQALTALEPGTAYEIHYSGATQPVQGYLLGASGLGAECFASGASAAAGTWSQTGLFEHSGNLILNDLPSGLTEPNLEGHLCTITPASSGELVLDLRMYMTDSATMTTYEMVGSVVVTVGTP